MLTFHCSPFRLLGIVAVASHLACGGRTGLDLGESLNPASADAGSPELTIETGSARLDGATVPDATLEVREAETSPDVALNCPSCDDHLTCTLDSCDRATGQCLHVPNDALCPSGHRCTPPMDCTARIYANTSSQLLDVTVPTGEVRAIGSWPNPITDITLTPNGQLYAVDFASLYSVNPSDATLTLVGSWQEGTGNALGQSSNTVLYLGVESEVRTLDLATGRQAIVALFPPGCVSSGDVAIVRGSLYATANCGVDNDELVRIDLATTTSTRVGSLGFAMVYGLATVGDTLYGLTGDGLILRIDPTNATAHPLATTAYTFWGAAGN